MTGLNDPFAPLGPDERSRTEPTRNDVDGWRPILPVPADAPTLTKSIAERFAPTGYAFSASWDYCDASGRLLGSVVRYDAPANGAPAGKEVKPFTYCEGSGGRREWRCRGFSEPRPLYRLDHLAHRPEAPVLVVEGEKSADAAATRIPDHVVTTSPGGSNGVHKAEWAPLAGRHVVIWPDADAPGARYADDLAEMLRKIGAASVRTVALPPGLPNGWDLADELPSGWGDAHLVRLLTEASTSRANDPLPLFPPRPPSEPYPTDALGPVLSSAAEAIARNVQVPAAMAAQSVLAAASLAAQAHADVLLPFGQPRPLSLYLVTVAASGDRKTSSDNEALWPIRKHEKALRDRYEAEHATYAIAHASWTAERRKIEGDKKLNYDTRKTELRNLGPEPPRPLHPFLTAADPTIEGLVKAWPSAHASLGIFTAEGGQFTNGHGMSQENRLRTAAACSELWDSQPIKRVRAADGVNILRGRRLAVHLMIQPEAAASFMSDQVLRDQGLLSRMLVAAPDSLAGTRFYRDALPTDDAAIRAYGARLLSLLEAPWPLAPGKPNELEPRTLIMSADVAAEWRKFHDHIESQCGRGQDLSGIQDFAAKAAEHAARIAGVLTIVEDRHAGEISPSAMEGALALADWYVAEALRLHGAARTDPRLLRAHQLLLWMQSQDREEIEFRDILRLGPGPVRTKAMADEAVAILMDHNWLEHLSARPRRFRAAPAEVR